MKIIRQAIYRDILSMLDIEHMSYENPANIKFFEKHLKNTLVCVEKRKVKGYLVYTVASDGYIEILNIAVNPQYRREGVATLLVNVFKDNPEFEGVFAFCSEKNYPYQCFLRKCGIICKKIHRNYYEPNDDAYVFVYNNNTTMII